MKKILLILATTLMFTSCVKENQLEGKCGTIDGVDYTVTNGQYTYYVKVCFAVNCVWQAVNWDTYMNARVGQKICF